jgi:hypothetical protein
MHVVTASGPCLSFMKNSTLSSEAPRVAVFTGEDGRSVGVGEEARLSEGVNMIP